MGNKLLFENYLESLKQKYNAACFDIDGTLTINNSENEDFSMTFSGSSSLDTEATVEDIELPSTALNIMDILGALGIIGGTVSGI